jgi:hypothetical protein
MSGGQHAICVMNRRTIAALDLETGQEIAAFSADSDVVSFAAFVDRIILGDRGGACHVLCLEK